MSELKVGKEYSMVFPFTRSDHSAIKGNFLIPAQDAFHIWSTGCELHEECDGSGYGMSRDFTANGEGQVIYSILAITELIGRHEDRVIFKRWLINPDGKKYNNGEVRMLTRKAFEKDINSRSPFRADYELDIKE